MFHWTGSVMWPGTGGQCLMCPREKGPEFGEHVAVSVIIFVVMVKHSFKKFLTFVQLYG